MQLIGEAYALMRQALGLTSAELSDVFAQWNATELDSYLIEITSKVLAKQDPETGNPLVEMILDAAGQKGTGKWTSQVSLDLGVPLTLITEAVFARNMSALKEERVAAAQLLKGPRGAFKGERAKFIEDIRNALYASKIISYAQGFAMMRAPTRIPLEPPARPHRPPLARRLHHPRPVPRSHPGGVRPEASLPNLLLDKYFKRAVSKAQSSWRRVVREAVRLGIPVPTFSAALNYYDSYRSANLPANLLQAQRDYFGAHTFERIDKPRGEFFHADWN